MLITTTILSKYNPQLDEYDDYEYEYVEVPTRKIASIMAKRFGITSEQMYNIITEFEDYTDFSEYFSEDLEVQNLAREFYNPEEEE